MNSLLDKFFKLKENGTTIKTEIIAGLTTFLAMAYILAVNPSLLEIAGMDKGAVFVATVLAAIVGTLFMGLFANFPIALAPGMGLNAFFAFTVAGAWGIPWQTALSGVFVSGVVFMLLTASGIREKIVNMIPGVMKYSVSAGIGLFIAFLGLQNAKIIVPNEATAVGLGDLHNGAVLLAVFGIVLSILLVTAKVNGGIFIGMVATAVIGMITGVISTPTAIVGAVPDVSSTFGQAIINLPNIFTWQMLVVILTFFFVDFFDTAGTLVAVATQAGLVNEKNEIPRAGRALFADAAATTVGAVFGTSTTTAYVESASGASVGGRTGLTAVVVAIMFGVSIFFSPLLSVITSAVTAPALVIVGIMMLGNVRHIEWTKFEIATPAFFTIIMMVLTYSIAEGIAIGFIFYPITMLVAKRGKEVHPLMYVLMVLFILYFAFILQ